MLTNLTHRLRRVPDRRIAIHAVRRRLLSLELLEDRAVPATLSFFPKADYAVGDGPLSVAVGDFNGDGRPDLAAANNFSDSVSVLRNAGGGAFAPKADYAVGHGPWSVAVGDFNGDGWDVLATANNGTDSVSMLLNTTTASPTEVIDRVAGGVQALGLPGKVTRGILSKLDAAKAALELGNDTATRNLLGAAIRQLEALVRAHKLDESLATTLIADLETAAALI